jgi:hypothetical protein
MANVSRRAARITLRAADHNANIVDLDDSRLTLGVPVDGSTLRNSIGRD